VKKVDSEYWEHNWRDSGLPRAVDPERDTLRNHSYHEFHLLFSKYLINSRAGAWSSSLRSIDMARLFRPPFWPQRDWN